MPGSHAKTRRRRRVLNQNPLPGTSMAIKYGLLAARAKKRGDAAAAATYKKKAAAARGRRRSNK